MKVSVIIPVYNTGEYLRECVLSVCGQLHTDLQIILVDDGSDTTTAALCDELEVLDPRVEVIHKQNQGVSIARNTGMDRARGDVVCFVDSDDTVSPHMIGRLVGTLLRTDAQIAMCDAVTIRPGKPDQPDTIPLLPATCVLKTDGIKSGILAQIAGAVWRCAYKAELFKSGAVKFPEGIKFSEDRIFNLLAMGAAAKIAYIKEPYYNRLIREGSACFRYYPDMTAQIIAMREVLLNTVRKNWGPEYIPAYERQVAGHILGAVTNYSSTKGSGSRGESLRQLRQLCSQPPISDCLANAGMSDLRSRLILQGRYKKLYCIGLFTNLYHRICRRGQYQV